MARILIQISNCKGNKKARDYLLGYRRSLKFEGKEPLYTRVEELYQDTKDIADILLDAEVKLGEMLEKIEPIYDPPTVGSKKGTYGNRPKKKKTLPPGITKKQSHEAQEIARHNGN